MHKKLLAIFCDKIIANMLKFSTFQKKREQSDAFYFMKYPVKLPNWNSDPGVPGNSYSLN